MPLSSFKVAIRVLSPILISSSLNSPLSLVFVGMLKDSPITYDDVTTAFSAGLLVAAKTSPLITEKYSLLSSGSSAMSSTFDVSELKTETVL